MLNSLLNMLGVGGFGRGGLFGRRRSRYGAQRSTYGMGLGGVALPMAAWYAWRHRDQIKGALGRFGGSRQSSTMGSSSPY
jgi:hypothetical protein